MPCEPVWLSTRGCANPIDLNGSKLRSGLQIG
jgi:hypothetical protein